MNARFLTILVALSVSAAATAAEPTVTLKISADRPGAKINPAMWGIFFEDINFGADGGLYAELVKNRSFEFPDPMMGWSQIKTTGAAGSLTVLDQNPLNPANPHYLRVKVDTAGEGFGLSNEGFRGMGVRAGRNLQLLRLCPQRWRRAQSVAGRISFRRRPCAGFGKS